MKKLILLLLLSSCITINIYEAQPEKQYEGWIRDYIPDYNPDPSQEFVPFWRDSLIIIGDGTGWQDTLWSYPYFTDTILIDSTLWIR